MRELAQLLRGSENWLVERVQAHARERGYSRHTTIMRLAWQSSVARLSSAMDQVLPGGMAAVELEPQDVSRITPVESFAVEESRLHRARGVDLGMFLGLLSYYRQAYLDLVEESALEAETKSLSLRFVARFFDRLVTAVAVEWNSTGETEKLAELRAESLRVQHEKHRLGAVFQALPSPVLLLDPAGRVLDLNQTACQWLDQAAPGLQPLADGGTRCRADHLGQDAETLLPWVAPALTRMRSGAPDEQSFLTRNTQGESLSFLDTHVYPLFGVGGGFEGVVVVIQDVTALRDATEAQARIASELRGQLREASSLNRLTEILSRPADSTEELLESLAAALPDCWDSAGGLSARIRFDGRDYSHGNADACGALLEEPLTVLGEARGRIGLCSLSAEQGFPPGDAALLASIARHLEHVLETRLTLTLLGQSEKRFRDFFNNAADAIFIHDADGRILDANKNAGIWLNMPTETLAGKNLLDHMAPDDRKATASRFLNALRGDPQLFQATLLRRDGFAIPAELLCQAQNFQGQAALVSTGRNITDRLRDQAEIERRLELEALVAGVSARLLNTAAEDLSQAMRDSLADICRFLGMRRAGVFLFDARGASLKQTYFWRDEGLLPLPSSLRNISPAKMPWFAERILAGERVFIRDIAHVPPAGRKEKALLAQASVASLIAVPMRLKDRLLGVLCLVSDTPLDAARINGSQLLDQVTLLFSNAIERRRASLALRESEGLARAILDALPANICVLNKQGVLTMVNRSWGISGPESTPLSGKGRRLRLGGNYLEACRAAAGNTYAALSLEGILAVLAGRAASFSLEYPTRQGGEQHWHFMQVTPFARGKSGAVVSHRDITERMRAVQEVRESEQRFRIIVETALEAVLKIDTQGQITYANPRVLSMLGYAPEELLGRSLSDLLEPQDQEILQQKIKRRRQGFSDQYELRFRHKNGQRIYTLINASPVTAPDGAVTGSIGMITDISDRVRADARLRRNEARYRSLVESMHEGLIMTKRDGIISYVNDRFCVMLGRRKNELIGRPASTFAEEGSEKRLAEMLSGTHAGGPEEILWEHATGRHVYSLVSPSAFADEEGRTAGFFAVVTDTTERKGLESQLLQSQKLEAIGQLAAGIAHEINTPAQYVGNNVQFIKTAFEDMLAVCAAVHALVRSARTAPPPPADFQALERLMQERDVEYLSTEVPGAIAQTLEGVERISTIVRSVKQFAHPGAAVMAPADLNESMKSTATVSRNEWKYVAELDLDLDPDLPLVVCMIGEINQVVLNLIINAAHAIADAKKTDPSRVGRITLSTRKSPPWAEIRVGDTGTGIPETVQAHIFDPFFTTKEVGRGTGQGLTISRTIIVEKHKGQLFFETEEGMGSTFVVRLPLEQREEPTQ